MAVRRPFKKDLTPIGRGGITKHVGKGATEQRRAPGGDEQLTGGNPFQSAQNRYPKPAPPPPDMGEPDADDLSVPSPPVPMGEQAPRAPSALMPPFGIGQPPEDDSE